MCGVSVQTAIYYSKLCGFCQAFSEKRYNKKYFDFSKIEGERKGNVVKQIENGKVKREFAADDGEHLSFYSEFDDSGVRTMDVEFREDTTVKSIRKYKNGEFSKISFYEKDGITLAKNFEDEDEALRFGLDFE